MKKIIAYSEQDIANIRVLLDGIAVHGIQNCRNIVVIDQILNSGSTGELKEPDEKKEGDG